MEDADGRTWSDVSAWHWAALLRRSSGPWRRTVVARVWHPDGYEGRKAD